MSSMNTIKIQLKTDLKHCLLGLISASLFLFFSIYIFKLIEPNDLEGIFLSIAFLIISVFLIIMILYNNVYGKSYIEIDDKKINYTNLFGNKLFLWKDVYSIEEFTANYNCYIGIVSKESANMKINFLIFLSYSWMIDIKYHLLNI